VSVALTDVKEGEGGFAIVPGSHKANLPPPPAVLRNEAPPGVLQQPALKAGDAVLFSEATMHGALPWQPSDERRFALYRYGPAHHGYGRGYLDGWSDEMMSDLSPEERVVLEPPYGNRLDRPSIRNGSAKVYASRSQKKKEFDQELFGKPYF